MKKLLIIGAGGCGREALQWAKDINNKTPRWNIKGFIDDDLTVLSGLRCEFEILSTINDYSITPNDEFICCIGNSNIRESVIKRMKDNGAKFTNLIHPTAIVAESSKIGEAVILYPFSLVSDNAEIGDGCIINMYSSIAHDSVLDRYCTISAHCDVTGMCKLGKRVFMGSTANMVPGVHIGDDVFICAGSTVMSNIKNQSKIFGTPARKVAF